MIYTIIIALESFIIGCFVEYFACCCMDDPDPEWEKPKDLTKTLHNLFKMTDDEDDYYYYDDDDDDDEEDDE